MLVSSLNGYFEGVMNACMGKIIEKEFIAKGVTSSAQDAANDIAQHCDEHGLKNEMITLAIKVDQQIQNMSSTESDYDREASELLVQNLGGMMQILIAR